MVEIFPDKIALKKIHNFKVIRGINLSSVFNSGLYMNTVEKDSSMFIEMPDITTVSNPHATDNSMPIMCIFSRTLEEF